MIIIWNEEIIKWYKKKYRNYTFINQFCFIHKRENKHQILDIVNHVYKEKNFITKLINF